MKRLLLTTVALSLFATPMAFAAGPHVQYVPPHHSLPQHVMPKPQPKPHWQTGHRMPNGTHYTAVSDWKRYHLRQPPKGQHWVKVGNDYLLIGITTGLIATFLQGN
ncbi:MAG TPA: RcnB family protein [Devosiaceae bacterium]|jgi:Ni/Co efflux regulator RcnB